MAYKGVSRRPTSTLHHFQLSKKLKVSDAMPRSTLLRPAVSAFKVSTGNSTRGLNRKNRKVVGAFEPSQRLDRREVYTPSHRRTIHSGNNAEKRTVGAARGVAQTPQNTRSVSTRGFLLPVGKLRSDVIHRLGASVCSSVELQTARPTKKEGVAILSIPPTPATNAAVAAAAAKIAAQPASSTAVHSGARTRHTDEIRGAARGFAPDGGKEDVQAIAGAAVGPGMKLQTVAGYPAGAQPKMLSALKRRAVEIPTAPLKPAESTSSIAIVPTPLSPATNAVAAVAAAAAIITATLHSSNAAFAVVAATKIVAQPASRTRDKEQDHNDDHQDGGGNNVSMVRSFARSYVRSRHTFSGPCHSHSHELTQTERSTSRSPSRCSRSSRSFSSSGKSESSCSRSRSRSRSESRSESHSRSFRSRSWCRSRSRSLRSRSRSERQMNRSRSRNHGRGRSHSHSKGQRSRSRSRNHGRGHSHSHSEGQRSRRRSRSCKGSRSMSRGRGQLSCHRSGRSSPRFRSQHYHRLKPVKSRSRSRSRDRTHSPRWSNVMEREACRFYAGQDSRGYARQESRGDRRQGSRGDELQDSRGDAPQGSRGDAWQDSRGDALQSSRGDALQSSRGDARQDSRGDTRQCSRGDALQSSRGDALQGPRGDARQCSRGDARQGARGDTLQGSRGDALQSSRGDALQGPRGDALQGSRGDARQDSRGDALQGSRGDTRQNSRGDALQGKHSSSGATKVVRIVPMIASNARDLGDAEQSTANVSPQALRGLDKGGAAHDWKGGEGRVLLHYRCKACDHGFVCKSLLIQHQDTGCSAGRDEATAAPQHTSRYCLSSARFGMGLDALQAVVSAPSLAQAAPHAPHAPHAAPHTTDTPCTIHAKCATTANAATPLRAPRASEVTALPLSYPRLNLEEFKGVLRTRVIPLRHRYSFTIGREKDKCFVPVRDDSVSKEHAVIIDSEGVISLMDLDTVHGTFVIDVQGTPCRLKPHAQSVLQDGSEFTLARSTTRYKIRILPRITHPGNNAAARTGPSGATNGATYNIGHASSNLPWEAKVTEASTGAKEAKEAKEAMEAKEAKEAWRRGQAAKAARKEATAVLGAKAATRVTAKCVDSHSSKPTNRRDVPRRAQYGMKNTTKNKTPKIAATQVSGFTILIKSTCERPKCVQRGGCRPCTIKGCGKGRRLASTGCRSTCVECHRRQKKNKIKSNRIQSERKAAPLPKRRKGAKIWNEDILRALRSKHQFCLQMEMQQQFAVRKAIEVIESHRGNIMKMTQLTPYIATKSEKKLSQQLFSYIEDVLEERKPVDHPPPTDRQLERVAKKGGNRGGIPVLNPVEAAAAAGCHGQIQILAKAGEENGDENGGHNNDSEGHFSGLALCLGFYKDVRAPESFDTIRLQALQQHANLLTISVNDRPGNDHQTNRSHHIHASWTTPRGRNRLLYDLHRIMRDSALPLLAVFVDYYYIPPGAYAEAYYNTGMALLLENMLERRAKVYIMRMPGSILVTDSLASQGFPHSCGTALTNPLFEATKHAGVRMALQPPKETLIFGPRAPPNQITSNGVL